MPSRQTGAKPGHERGLSDFSAPATPGDAQQQQQQQQKQQQQQQHARGPASPASSTSSAAAAAAAGGRLEVHSSHHHQRCGSGGSGAAAHAHRHAAADAHKPRWVSTFSGPSRQGFSSPEPLTMPPGAAAAAAAALQSARSRQQLGGGVGCVWMPAAPLPALRPCQVAGPTRCANDRTARGWRGVYRREGDLADTGLNYVLGSACLWRSHHCVCGG